MVVFRVLPTLCHAVFTPNQCAHLSPCLSRIFDVLIFTLQRVVGWTGFFPRWLPLNDRKHHPADFSPNVCVIPRICLFTSCYRPIFTTVLPCIRFRVACYHEILLLSSVGSIIHARIFSAVLINWEGHNSRIAQLWPIAQLWEPQYGYGRHFNANPVRERAVVDQTRID